MNSNYLLLPLQHYLKNRNVVHNYLKLKPSILVFPIVLMGLIFLYLYSQNALDANRYIEIQKNCFMFLNKHLGKYADLQMNLTLFGNFFIFISFLCLLVFYTPKVWEALLPASLISGIFSFSLKKIFAVPRPARAWSDENFIIIGKKLEGINSCPSGHSITIFTIITVLLFSFMPTKLKNKIWWFGLMILIGGFLVISRVATGAHYPLDVLIGSILGYISGLLGIFIIRNHNIHLFDKKYYPIIIIIFIVSCIIMSIKLINENLIIYYFSILSFIFSIYKISYAYFKN